MNDCGLCFSEDDAYRLVAENDHAVSVVIYNPVNATHQMILPKNHVIQLEDLTPEEAKGFMDMNGYVLKRLMELYEDHPPVISIQTGRHSSQPHIHSQVFSSDTHIRDFYARSHTLSGEGGSPIGGYSVGITPRGRTHPTEGGDESEREKLLGDIATFLRGSGDLENDRNNLTELSHSINFRNGF